MDRKCRACLEEANHLVLITKQHLVRDEMRSVAEIINSCTSVQISDTTTGESVCDRCVNDALTTYTFIKRCETSEQVLKQLEIKNEALELTVERFDDEIELFQCPNCPVKFTTKDDLNSHKCDHCDTNTEFNCCFCNKQFNSELKLNKHLFKHSPTNNLRSMRHARFKAKPLESSDSEREIKTEFEPKSGELSNEILRNSTIKNQLGVYVCVCCPETFLDIAKLRLHTRTHTNYPCKLCKKKFTLITNLRRHLRSHSECFTIKSDDTESEYKCVSCGETFKRRKQLSDHLKTHKDFSCSMCNARFTFITNLRKHLRWHNRPKDEIRVWKQPPTEKRTCDICFKVFKFRPSMLKHRKKHDSVGKQCLYCTEATVLFESAVLLSKHMEEAHENEKNVVCAQCGKRFFKEWNLKMHMLVHTGAKPYMCEICGASFALGGNLASHKRVHTGTKPYRCSTCGRGFTQQAALRSHEASHSSRRDHVCPDCGAAFSRAGAMRNHQKRHNRENRLFACSMCDKRFTFSSERKRHMTIHTGEKRHQCDVCGKAFNRLTNLTVHKRIHTGETPHKCNVCGKGFIQVHCLRTHLNTHNGALERLEIRS